MTDQIRLAEKKRGDTWTYAFPVVDSAGAPVILTGCSARMHWRTPDGTLVLALSTGNGDISINEYGGMINVRIESEVMIDVDPGEYVSDVELTYPDGTVDSTPDLIIPIIGDQTHD